MKDTNYSPQEVLKQHPLWFYIRKNKLPFALGMFFLLVTNIVDSLYPLILKKGIDQIAAGESAASVAATAALFLATMTFLGLSRYCWRIFFGRYHTLAAEDLRNRIFTHLTSMGPQFFKRNPIGELISLITNDVQSFRQAIGSGVLILVDGITLILIVLPLMVWMEPSWTWQVLIFIPLVPLLIWKVTKLIFNRFKIQQDRLSDLSGFSQEIVAGIRVTKSFAQENNQLSAYNRLSRVYEQACNRSATVDALFSPVMQFGVASGTVILLFIAGPDVLAGTATLGTLVAFQRYISKMVWPMSALGMGLSQFQKGMASFARIKEVLIQKTDIPDEGEIDIGDFESMEVRGLSFNYPESPSLVLKDIHFKIQAGQKVALVGPVGSGKTTLLHLLTRLYPAPENSIFINGLEIQKITQRSLHSQIAMVPQEPFLFSQSIAENLKFGRQEPIPDEEIHHWAKVVDIQQEISNLPEQFQSELGERGVNLSGGQKQRLTIARGLMTKAPMIILDDSLSAVDHKTEKTIQAQLTEPKDRRKTQLIVTHRLSAVENADQVIVLNQGQIEAIGTHRELIRNSPTYRRMAEIQGYDL
jgi:ATP-binding cassette subfamily B multidrug efflux pump